MRKCATSVHKFRSEEGETSLKNKQKPRFVFVLYDGHILQYPKLLGMVHIAKLVQVKHSPFPIDKSSLWFVFYSQSCYHFKGLEGFDKYFSITGSLTGWRDQLFSLTTLSVPDNFLKSSHYVAIWPIPPGCFCTVKNKARPLLYRVGRQCTHALHLVTNLSQTSKSLIFQTSVQAIDMGNIWLH